MILGALALALLAFALGKRERGRFTDRATPVPGGEGETRRKRFVRIVKRATPAGLRWQLVAVHSANETGYGRTSYGWYLFGIKSTGWTGRVAVKVPVEIVRQGEAAVAAWRARTNAEIARGRTPSNAFRAYRSHAESVRDYVAFVRRRFPAVYAILTEPGAPTADDAARYAHALTEGGNRAYVQDDEDPNGDRLADDFGSILAEVKRLA